MPLSKLDTYLSGAWNIRTHCSPQQSLKHCPSEAEFLLSSVLHYTRPSYHSLAKSCLLTTFLLSEHRKHSVLDASTTITFHTAISKENCDVSKVIPISTRATIHIPRLARHPIVVDIEASAAAERQSCTLPCPLQHPHRQSLLILLISHS